MPTRALSPVESQVGHGAPGLRAPLRDIGHFLNEPGGTPQVFVEGRLGVPLESSAWAAVEGYGDGPPWRAPFTHSFDDVFLDVVAVSTSLRDLVRVESVTECAALAGSFYFESVSVAPEAAWDQPEAVWDGAVGSWDDAGSIAGWLYVNASAKEVTSEDALIIARVPALLSSTDAVTQPILGPDILAGLGGAEDWDGSAFPSWTLDDASAENPGSAPGGTVEETQVYVREGDAAFAFRGFAGLLPASIYRDSVPAQTGGVYVLHGWYRPLAGGAAGFGLAVSPSGSNNSVVQDDGRSVKNTSPLTLPYHGDTDADDTSDEPWRRFAFYFVSPSSSLRIRLGRRSFTVPVGAEDELAIVDGVKLQRVFRWLRYEPSLLAESSLNASEGQKDRYFGLTEVGASQIQIANDGLMETRLGSFDCLQAEVIVRYGGRFPGGEEITYDALKVGAAGRAVDPEVGENKVQLSVEDIRGTAQADVPERTFEQPTFPNADPRLASKPRPFFFGYQRGLVPARIARTDAQLPRYEICDCDEHEPGIVGSDPDTGHLSSVTVYEDEDAAAREDVSKAQVLDALHITDDLPHGRFDAISCLKLVPVDEEHQFFSIKVNGGAQIDVRVLDGNEELFNLTLDADGPSNTFGVTGAPTVWQAVQFIDGAFSNNVTSSAVTRSEVECATLSGSAAISFVELVSRVAQYQGVFQPFELGEKWRPYIEHAAVRYYKDYVTDGSFSFIEYTHRWTAADLGLSEITDSDVNGFKWGIEYDPNGGEPLTIDLMQPRVQRFKTVPASASAPSVRTPLRFAAALERAMLIGASLSTGIAVTWSDDDESPLGFKFTITGSGAVTTLDLLTKTGRQKSGWAMLGFATDNDQTGALTYTAAQAYYVPDTDIDVAVVRASYVGYADDADGTYTGTAGKPIEKGADIIRFLLRRHIRVAADRIDDASFDDVRVAGEQLAVWVGETGRLDEIMATICTSDLADLVIDGDRYFYTLRSSTFDEVRGVELFDRDFIGGLTSRPQLTDVYGTVRVLYDFRPSKDAPQSMEQGTPARVRYSRKDKRDWNTYHLTAAAATEVLNAIVAPASVAKRRYTISCRGQLARVRFGQVFRINPVRGGMSDSTGSVGPVDLILLQKDTDFYSHACNVQAVEV